MKDYYLLSVEELGMMEIGNGKKNEQVMSLYIAGRKAT